MSQLENRFQSKLITELKSIFPGAVVTLTDPSHIQGLPDILILHGSQWAMLECKRSERAPHRPNQQYYVDLFDDWSYAAFIYPENKEEVLNELQRLFKTQR